MTPKTGRAVIFEADKLICIKRTRYTEDGQVKREYYTFPGGHLEGNESYEEATVREVFEELGLNVKIKQEFIFLHNDDLARNEKFFIADIIDGELGTGNGPEFQNIDYKKYGKYEIVKLEKNKLKEYNLLPIEVRDKIIVEL